MQIWNSHHELDRASISNFKAPGLKMKEGNCSKLFIISDALLNAYEKDRKCSHAHFFFKFSQDLFLSRVLNGIIESQHVHFETNCDRREMTISAILRRVGNLRLVNCRLFSFDGRLSLKSHYETLGVSVSASKKEIREGYIKKSKVWWEYFA